MFIKNPKVIEAMLLTQMIADERGWTLTKAALKVAKTLKLDNDEWRELITSL